MNFSSIKSSKNLQNSIWNIIEVLLGPFILFVSIPVFLKFLGPEKYGIWMFVNTVIIVMQAFNLGLNSSTYKHVSTSLVKDDQKQIQNTLNTNLSLTIFIFLFSLIVCGVLSYTIYSFDWFAHDITDKKSLIIGLFLGTFILFVKLSEQILFNVYRAFENFRYVTIISILVKTGIVGGNILIAYLTQNIVLILGYTALISVIGLIINYRTLNRFIPHYIFRFSVSKQLIRYEVNYSLFVWIQSIAVILAYQGDRLLVSYVFGFTILSYYTIVSTIFNHIHMAFGAVTSWLFPQIAKNKDDKQLVFSMYLNARNVLTVISVLLLCLFCLISPTLFSIWLGQENYLQIKDYLKWFSVFEFFFVFTIIPNYFLNASENERFSLRMVVLFTSLNIAGMLVGVFLYKTVVAMLMGLVISTVLGMLIYHFFIGQRFAKSNNVLELFLLFIPSALGSGTAYFDVYWLKLLSFGLCLISIYFVFIKYQRTNFKILIQ